MNLESGVYERTDHDVVSSGTPVSRAEWDAFVDRSPQGSVYCKSWWLDAVCPNEYDLVAIRRDGVIRAGMAIPIVRRRGRSTVQMPPLTQTLGPLLWLPHTDKYGSRLTYEMKILRELIAALPPTDEFSINCHQRFTNCLPFHWAGYSQTTRYTYQIDDLTDLRSVYDGMSDKTRNIIRKAERSGIRIEECDELGSALQLFEMTYTRQGIGFPYDPELVGRIDRGAGANASRKIFLAKDRSGRLHAAIYVVYTPQSAYYVMQGTDPELRASGAALLAHWHAIQFAATVSQRYDFVGSMIESVEHVFRSFGAVQVPYSTIFRHRRITLRELATIGKKWLIQRLAPAAALLLCPLPDGLTGTALNAPGVFGVLVKLA